MRVNFLALRALLWDAIKMICLWERRRAWVVLYMESVLVNKEWRNLSQRAAHVIDLSLWFQIRNCHFSRYDSGSKPGTRVVYAARAIMESLPAALPIQLVWEVGYLRSALCLRGHSDVLISELFLSNLCWSFGDACVVAESSHCACWDIQSAEHASGGTQAQIQL